MPAVAVPVIAAMVYLDAPRGTLELIRAWRDTSSGRGRRALVLTIVEEDGIWTHTEVQKQAAPPPQPQPRLVLRRDGIGGVMDSIKGWLGRV